MKQNSVFASFFMPFRSEKQRRYLWMNEPKIAKKWTKKYGSKPKKLRDKLKSMKGKKYA